MHLDTCSQTPFLLGARQISAGAQLGLERERGITGESSAYGVLHAGGSTAHIPLV